MNVQSAARWLDERREDPFEAPRGASPRSERRAWSRDARRDVPPYTASLF